MSILPIFIPHAGCPHQCVYCNQRAISGQQDNSIEQARRQIAAWLPRLRPGQAHEAAFYGGSFTALPLARQEELLALTDQLLAAGLIQRVRLSTRPDCVNLEVLELLQAHQVYLVELGAQSLDDRVLQAAGRGHGAQAVVEAVALLKRQGLAVGLQLMLGLPGQDGASVAATAQLAASLRPQVARIYPLLVLEGTPLAASYRRGEYQPLSLAAAVEQGAYLYAALTAVGSRVIRIGLPPEVEQEEPGAVLAGPWHPNLGLLVKARAWREACTPLLEEQYRRGERPLVLDYPPGQLDLVQGYKKENLAYWQARFPDAELLLQVREG